MKYGQEKTSKESKGTDSRTKKMMTNQRARKPRYQIFKIDYRWISSEARMSFQIKERFKLLKT